MLIDKLIADVAAGHAAGGLAYDVLLTVVVIVMLIMLAGIFGLTFKSRRQWKRDMKARKALRSYR